MIIGCKTSRFLALFFLIAFSACTGNTAKSYLLKGEKHWSEGSYKLAVIEFDHAAAADPVGRVGQVASFRAAMTEALFLDEPELAIQRFKQFLATESNPELIWESQIQIGEILFTKLHRYQESLVHYQSLVRKNVVAPEVPLLLFRIGQCHYFLWQFDDAISTYFELEKKFSTSLFAEKAAFEIGMSYLAKAERLKGEVIASHEAFQSAIGSFERFKRMYPENTRVPEAEFGVASALESLGRDEEALAMFETIKAERDHPSPLTVEVKIFRLKERKSRRLPTNSHLDSGGKSKKGRSR